jgi:hypothetical protein
MSKECDIKCARSLPIYHLDQQTQILAEKAHRTRLSFDVPDVPPGKYLVVVYDGSESGLHYTWETFRVTAGTAPAKDVLPDGDPSPAPLLLGAGLLASGLILGWILGRRHLLQAAVAT